MSFHKDHVATQLLATVHVVILKQFGCATDPLNISGDIPSALSALSVMVKLSEERGNKIYN